jgi:hypothetical protein
MPLMPPIPLMPLLMPLGTAHRGDATQAAATAGVPECWQQAEQVSRVCGQVARTIDLIAVLPVLPMLSAYSAHCPPVAQELNSMPRCCPAAVMP